MLYSCARVSTVGVIRCLFDSEAEHEYKYKYRIKTSKNNKKEPTVPDRRTDKTRQYKHKYTKSSKLHVIRTDDQSKCEQVASFHLQSQCHQIWSLVHSQYGSAGYTNKKICHKTYLQHSKTSIAVTHKSNQTIIHHKNIGLN